MDYRAPMTRVEFDAISPRAEYPIDAYWEPLIDCNPHNLYELPPESLTRGQRLFMSLGVFDSQVCNGGITQFFWNRPESVADVEEALRELGEADLLAHYSRAVETVIGKQADWVKLREAAYSDSKTPDWEPFRQSYELLDLDWFEKAYFDRRRFDEQERPVILQEGLQSPFIRRLAAWVKAHPEEFITG
jgi:hypothetical protein